MKGQQGKVVNNTNKLQEIYTKLPLVDHRGCY